MLAYNFFHLVQASQANQTVSVPLDHGADFVRTIHELVSAPFLGFNDHVTTRERAEPLTAIQQVLPFHKFAQNLEAVDREEEAKVRQGTYIVVDEAAREIPDPFELDKPAKEEDGWDLL